MFFSPVYGVLSLASDYIIARLGCAVNHYLSFNKRGATTFQVLLPRQLSTYFATVLRSVLPLTLGFRIVIESLYYVLFTPCPSLPLFGFFQPSFFGPNRNSRTNWQYLNWFSAFCVRTHFTYAPML